jgi:hypothetical protein
MSKETNSHYLVGYYTTHQPDGVHIKAHCTCGEKLEGVGHDESAAMSALWTKFLQHRKDNT